MYLTPSVSACATLNSQHPRTLKRCAYHARFANRLVPRIISTASHRYKLPSNPPPPPAVPPVRVLFIHRLYFPQRMISVTGITKAYGAKTLFENVTVQFTPGKRYGLTGPNGAGKSTFMKILHGEEEASSGS